MKNKDRKFGEASHYHVAMHGLTPLLLTDDQIAVAKARTLANPEDVPWWAWLAGRVAAWVG